MQIGKYKLSTVETGTFALDGGAMFGVIPKVLWERTNPADEKNRITLGARLLLLESGSKKILIDTGIGAGWDAKFESIYRIDQSENSLFRSLKSKEISPDEITDVIFTHLHFDHAGGAVFFENGRAMPAFPNATYHVQKKHFKWAQNPSDRDRASFVKDRYLPLAEEGMINLVNGNENFDDFIQFIPISGHTFGQQMIKISDGENTVLHCGDLLPTSSHVPIPFVMGYDLQPLVTVSEKLDLYPRAIEGNWKLFYEHDPECIMSEINKNEKGYLTDNKITEMD